MKIEIILCEQVDEGLKNYINVFDKIDVNTEKSFIDFTVVCNIDFEGCTDKTMIFHLFLFKVSNGVKKGLYLSEIQYEKDDITSKEDRFKIDFKNIPLDGLGDYTVEVVRNDSMHDKDGTDGPQIYREGDTVGQKTFSVNLKNEYRT